MKPSQVVITLRRIANAIENSKRPDQRLVAKDIRRVIVALTPGEAEQHVDAYGSPPPVRVQLETDHHNTSGLAWYGYFTVQLVPEELGPNYETAIHSAAKEDGAPLSVDEVIMPPEETPTSLSKHAGLYRYYVATAG